MKTQAMTAQTLTTSYAVVPESKIRPAADDEVVRFTVSNEGATNALDAKISARHIRTTGESDWIDVSSEIAVAATENGQLAVACDGYDEFAVFAKSASGTTAKVYGKTGKQDRVEELSQPLGLTYSIADEDSDTITVSLALSVQAARKLHVQCLAEAPAAAAGAPTQAADAVLTVSDGTNGSTLLGDDTAAALFQTTATGLLDVIATDEGGAVDAGFLLVVRDGSATGPILAIIALVFDAS